MNSIRSYLFSVVTAAMICAILKQLFKEKNSVYQVVHLLAGVFLAVTVLRPVFSISFAAVKQNLVDYREAAAAVVEDGQYQADDSLATLIKERVQTYILERSKHLHVEIAVDVRLSTDDLPVPVEVTVHGAVSPYAKAYLSELISQDLGVSKEKQIWIN